jgi:hypothetical protein
MDVERAREELAAVPPREFTKERNALAARLAQAGDRAAATRVKALRAAPVAAWAVNRLATAHPDLVDRLVEAAEQVATAQLGKDRTTPLGAAMTAYRGATDALLAGLDTQLSAGGVKASAPLRRRVESTLMAAAADPKTRRALRSGRLEEELAPAGFDLFSGATPAPRDETATGAPSSTVRERGNRPRAGAERPDRRRAPERPHRRSAGEHQVATREARAERQQEAKATAREARERERMEAKAAAAREKAAAAERLAPFAEAVAEAGRALADARRALAGASEEARRAAAAVAAATQTRGAAERALAAAKRRG